MLKQTILVFYKKVIKSLSEEQISETGYLDADLISRQCKIAPMSRFMEVKYNIPKKTKQFQKQKAEPLGHSVTTNKRYIYQIVTSSLFNRKNSNRKITDTQEPSENTVDVKVGKSDNICIKSVFVVMNYLVKPFKTTNWLKSWKQLKTTQKLKRMRNNC